jgi:hypothetical protein
MEFVMRGDFNINFLKNSIFKQQITLLFQTSYLFQSNTFHTRIGKVSRFVIDNIFLDHGGINSHLFIFNLFTKSIQGKTPVGY